MPLVPITLIPGLDNAFYSAMKTFLDFQQSGNGGVDKSEEAIKAAAAVFAAIATPAIDTYIKSGTVSTVVVGVAGAIPVAGTGIGSII
tara:strand:- start:496 stop:759 length:264 start_codon:yes stop_codon:yes gene_type:complete